MACGSPIHLHWQFAVAWGVASGKLSNYATSLYLNDQIESNREKIYNDFDLFIKFWVRENKNCRTLLENMWKIRGSIFIELKFRLMIYLQWATVVRIKIYEGRQVEHEKNEEQNEIYLDEVEKVLSLRNSFYFSAYLW